MEYKDYYKTLGVKREATQDEIKRAYRKLARKYHPDVSKEADAEARFKEVGEAYEVLKDSEKRAAYDQLGAGWSPGEEFKPPPGWEPGFEFQSGDFGGVGAGGFSDFFESLFGHPRAGARPGGGGFRARGQDHHVQVMVDLDDAYQGASRTITLHNRDWAADGRGQDRKRTLNVRIPRGIRQGQHIRLAGQGGPGIGGGPAGDLYLEVTFRPHPFYRVDGRDLYVDLPVAPWEATLGATVKAPTPEGVVDLKIPPGSSQGRKLRLKGRGIPSSPEGDLYAVLRIALPPADNDSAKQLYRDMERQLSFNPRAALGV